MCSTLWQIPLNPYSFPLIWIRCGSLVDIFRQSLAVSSNVAKMWCRQSWRWTVSSNEKVSIQVPSICSKTMRIINIIIRTLEVWCQPDLVGAWAIQHADLRQQSCVLRWQSNDLLKWWLIISFDWSWANWSLASIVSMAIWGWNPWTNLSVFSEA